MTEVGRSRLLTLVFTDLVESTGLKARLGDHAAAGVIARHHDLVRSLLASHAGCEVDSAGDGFFATFEAPSAAAGFALELQAAHHADAGLPPVRVGIHLGEVTERPAPPGSSKPLLVEGLAVDLAARIQSLARPGQVLLSRAAFDAARQRLRADDLSIEVAWLAHGPYLLKGWDDAVEIGEVGITGVSPLDAPPDSDKARRAVAPGDELTLGWRPAIGLLIPGREHWRLVEQLGTGAIGEVWLATHDKTHARRVFKFCFEAARLRGLKREVVLLRLLRERLGERHDIAQILDWEFERPPFFLETAYTEAGDLLAWSKRKGGIAAVPIVDRIEIAAQAAEALAAAHEAGILHKDLKPSNLLISEVKPAGGPRVCLTDFGIGLVTSRESLSAAGVTVAGMTETLLSSSSSSTGAGTRLYMAPEVIEGRPATEGSDVYGLGVVLYQMAIGDFGRALAPGWERAVEDEVLREDIAACLDGDAARRLASARELATRLRGLERRRAERHAVERGRVAAETSGRRRRVLFVASAATLLLVVVGAFFLRQQRALRGERERAERVRWAREEALPEIERLTRAGDLAGAFALAERAEAVIPTDPVLAERWSEIATTGTVHTDPPGAQVSVQPYAGDPAEWRALGESPVGVRLPHGVYRWRIEKDGYEPVDLARRPPDDAVHLKLLGPFEVELVPSGTIPAGMVRVAGGTYPVALTGFEGAPLALEPFFIDRFEVTNREFREFVEGGGYVSGEHWHDGQGREVRPGFVDRTGRPGPATWELGTYPNGEDDFPIRGVSWYEAEAYCRFRGKNLPTVYHWARAAFAPWELAQPLSNAIIPASNLAGDAPAPVGRHQGMVAYGAYDMAGNVKEWTSNATVDGRRYLLGGAWNEPGYLFYDPDAQSPAKRELNCGVRCMALESGGPIPERLAAPVGGVRSGPRKLKPVSDDVFASFLATGSYMSYTAGPLNGAINERDETHEHWIVETVSFDAAYAVERVPAYLLLPKNVSLPYQVVVYWPSGSANLQPSRDDLRQAVNLYLHHVLRSGRAVLYPVFKGTYDRRPAAPDPDVATKQTSDLNRSLDYLESRADIDADRIAYAGLSWGANMGAYLVRPGFERLEALILVAGGLPSVPLPPHSDAVNFAPRVRMPVLMINGRYDATFPVETSIEPLFRLFGAPEADKKLLLYDSGHVPQPGVLWLKEALDWLDRYLGPVDEPAAKSSRS